MNRIRLHFVLGAGLSSRLIAWYGSGYGGYSHVDAILSDGTLAGARSDAVGDRPPGFQIRPAAYEDWKRTATVEVPCAPHKALEWEMWLRKQVGRQYDKDAILGFVLGKRLHEEGHWICSAAQTEALRHVSLLYRTATVDSEITPNALFQLVTAGLGGKVTG